MSNEIRFIHTSDLQLGMTRWFLNGEAQSRFSQARLDAIKKLGRLAQETGAQFIVVAGDVFEHNALEDVTRGRAFEAFERLPVPVYLLPGNHDPLVADSIFKTRSHENVRVFEDASIHEVAPGVELVGAPYKSKRANRDLVAEAIRELEPTETIRIVVGHGQVESREAEASLDTIDLGGVEAAINSGAVDYLALGDTHSTASLGTTGAVWFSGAPETTDYYGVTLGNGESDSGNALVVTINKDGAAKATVEVDKHAVGEWTFEALDQHITSRADVDAFLKTLRDYEDKDRTVIKYGLQGTISLTDQAYLESSLAELEPIFASLRPRRSRMDLHLEPERDEVENLNVTGYARGALAELIEELDESQVARDAANLLFRLSQKGA